MKPLTIQDAATVGVPPLSQSRFELMACPHLYLERVIRGKYEPENEYSVRGSQIHKAAADYVTHLVKVRKNSDPEWFAANILNRPYLPDALEILGRMMDTFSIDPEKILDTEVWLPLDSDLRPLDCSDLDDPRVAVEGTPDLIVLTSPTSIDVDDYKSFYQVIEPDTFQSCLYPLLIFKHYEQIESVTFRLRFVRYGLVAREKTYTRDDVPALEKMVLEARRRQVYLHVRESEIGVTPGADEAMPGQHCAYCPRLRSCPLGDMNPMTEEPADVARRILWAQQLVKRDTAILKSHVNINGPIQIADANGSNYTATFKLQHKTSYPAVPCLALVSANDPELASKLTVSGLSQAIKAKKRSGLAGLLAEHKVERAQTRFSIVGGADDEEGDD